MTIGTADVAGITGTVAGIGELVKSLADGSGGAFGGGGATATPRTKA